MSGEYPTDWLTCRYPYDAEARDPDLEKLVIDLLRSGDSPVIVDLGAGNGSNYRYFSEKLPQNTTWICVERDPLLASELIKLGNNLEVICDDVMDLPKYLDNRDVTLVMANALFDLFPWDKLHGLLTHIHSREIPCYGTLNYTNMKFSPAHPSDTKVADLYHRHMQRPRPAGAATGPQAPYMIQQRFGVKCLAAPSTWNLSSDDPTIQSYLLGFMENAIPELPLTTKEQQMFEEWIELRRLQLQGSELGMVVSHVDLFIR